MFPIIFRVEKMVNTTARRAVEQTTQHFFGGILLGNSSKNSSYDISRYFWKTDYSQCDQTLSVEFIAFHYTYFDKQLMLYFKFPLSYTSIFR